MGVINKKQVMVSIDLRVLELFDKLERNRSDFIEKAMITRIRGVSKKDMPEDVLTLKCSKCGKSVDNGFFCEATRKFFCGSCNLEYFKLNDGSKNSRFACHYKGEHEHVKVPGFDNSRIELMKTIKEMEK